MPYTIKPRPNALILNVEDGQCPEVALRLLGMPERAALKALQAEGYTGNGANLKQIALATWTLTGRKPRFEHADNLKGLTAREGADRFASYRPAMIIAKNDDGAHVMAAFGGAHPV